MAVDIINFGEEQENTAKLEAFKVRTVSSRLVVSRRLVVCRGVSSCVVVSRRVSSCVVVYHRVAVFRCVVLCRVSSCLFFFNPPYQS